jgi:hypothetical protein
MIIYRYYSELDRAILVTIEGESKERMDKG